MDEQNIKAARCELERYQNWANATTQDSAREALTAICDILKSLTVNKET